MLKQLDSVMKMNVGEESVMKRPRGKQEAVVLAALTALTMRCERCGHEWVRRIATPPKKCPSCQHPHRYAARRPRKADQ